MTGRQLIGIVRAMPSVPRLRVVKPDGTPFGDMWHLPSGQGGACFGVLRPGDMGKRVYMCGDVVQIENDEQRDARKARLESLGYTARPAISPAESAMLDSYMADAERMGAAVRESGYDPADWEDGMNDD